MPTLEGLEELPKTQRERLAYIEVKAFFCGELTRQDIERRFGVKPAASTRDLAAYRRLAPSNLVYDPSLRKYLPTSVFSPIFEQSAERALMWFRSGVGDGLDVSGRRVIPCESAGELVSPDIQTLGAITRAITAGELVEVRYLSLSSGPSKKRLAPLALADTGMRWHLRAFDQDKKRFADFVLTRIIDAKPLNEPIPEDERLESDAQWARIVELNLVPHPGVKHAKAVEVDYAMVNGSLKVRLRAPMVGYALKRWGVDCSASHELDPSSHHLWLSNPQTLYGVESAALAPGYVAPKQALKAP
jgi:WYL domain